MASRYPETLHVSSDLTYTLRGGVTELGAVEEIPQPVNPSGALDSLNEGIASRDLLENYFEWRSMAANVDKPQGKELASIQADTRAWVEQQGILEVPTNKDECISHYSEYSEDNIRGKYHSLASYLRENYSGVISEAEFQATQLFIDSAFGVYADRPNEGHEVMEDADGSFAFVVPARVSRHNSEYGREVEPSIPLLRYLPNELRSQMLVGLPPFIIDTYKRDEDGRRGYLVLAPVFGDMVEDLDKAGGNLKDMQTIAEQNVNDAVDFAYQRFGVQVVGLGAVLPALTKFGQKITNPNVITTTGHGGTAELVIQTMESGLQRMERDLGRIGVLGMGSIGASIAEVLITRYPDADISIYDTRPGSVERVVKRNPDKFTVAESDVDLVTESDVVISAITGKFNLDQVERLERNPLVVDDSQPGSFDPVQTKKLGGNVVWVVGEDTVGIATRREYDYATMVNPNTDVFGCEAEAAILYAYLRDLKKRGLGEAAERIVRRVALRESVTANKVRLIGTLFDRYGIKASQPQAFGEPVDLVQS